MELCRCPCDPRCAGNKPWSGTVADTDLLACRPDLDLFGSILGQTGCHARRAGGTAQGSLPQVQAQQRLVASCVGKNDINTIGPVIPQILWITRPRNRGTVLQPISWFELSAFCAFCDATGGIGGRELEARRHALMLRAGMST